MSDNEVRLDSSQKNRDEINLRNEQLLIASKVKHFF